MTINLLQIMNDLEGRPIPDSDGNELTLKKVLCRALIDNFPSEKNVKGDEKIRRWLLAKFIYESTEVNLSIEDAALLKRIIGDNFIVPIIGQIDEIFQIK